MGYVCCIGCDRLIYWARDCSRNRISHDHSRVGFSERIGFGDGDSGRVFGHPVSGQSVAWVDRGNGNTHTDRDGRTWRGDTRRCGDVGYVCCIGCDRLIYWARDCSRNRISHDHSHVGFSERIGFGDDCSGSIVGDPVTDESEFRFVG